MASSLHILSEVFGFDETIGDRLVFRATSLCLCGGNSEDNNANVKFTDDAVVIADTADTGHLRSDSNENHICVPPSHSVDRDQHSVIFEPRDVANFSPLRVFQEAHHPLMRP